MVRNKTVLFGGRYFQTTFTFSFPLSLKVFALPINVINNLSTKEKLSKSFQFQVAFDRRKDRQRA